MGLVFKICIPHTFHQGFDYLAPTEMPVIGARVWVPFRQQTRLGVVVAKGQSDVDFHKLKPIQGIIDKNPLLSPELLSLCEWVSAYYQSPLSEVLALALPKKYREGMDFIPPVCRLYQLSTKVDKAHLLLSKKAHRQHALIDLIANTQQGLSRKDIVQAGFSQTQINALMKASLLTEVITKPQAVNPSKESSPPLPLNPEQAFATQQILQSLGQYHAYLLQGVTGSGKTEIYLQTIKEVLQNGQQALVLVPEIGLTPQLLTRFRQRFKEQITVIHSNLNDTERQSAWHAASNKEAKLIIGTRSAVFTPMPDLGIIVIDEEHDGSFKQMDGVRYSARDTALYRAYQANIPIILGSATPALESLYNCKANKYTRLTLTEKALSTHRLHYQVIDVRSQPLHHGMAEKTLMLIKKHLLLENQVLVFINRRGFSPVLLCHQCGWMADCQACDTHLTLHRNLNKLICHHCGLIKTIPRQCKQCGGQELIPIGAGTQRIHEYLSHTFPDTNVLRIDRDEIRKKASWDVSLETIKSGRAQLIVGTQMLAKGHHFPRLNLVVILDTDSGFYNQDFRAIERLGQLITQVAGRAGRAEHPGEVALQTHLPHHPVLNLLLQKGYDAFAEHLLQQRQKSALPPFQFLALIRAQSKQEERALAFLHGLKKHLLQEGLHILGPAPAPLARKSHQYRLQLLIKAVNRPILQNALTQMRGETSIQKLAKGVRWSIDVDPVDLA